MHMCGSNGTLVPDPCAARFCQFWGLGTARAESTRENLLSQYTPLYIRSAIGSQATGHTGHTGACPAPLIPLERVQLAPGEGGAFKTIDHGEGGVRPPPLDELSWGGGGSEEVCQYSDFCDKRANFWPARCARRRSVVCGVRRRGRRASIVISTKNPTAFLTFCIFWRPL